MGHSGSKRAPLDAFVNDPEAVAQDSIEGFLLTTALPIAVLDTFPERKVLVRKDWDSGRVAVITSTGAGHEPADLEYIGEGMLTAVTLGGVWKSPTTETILQAIAAVSGKAGCLVVAKNYVGGRINIQPAIDRAEAKLGLPVRVVYVADDVVSMMDKVDRNRARGIAGGVLVTKVAGAAAAAGLPLDDVYREAKACADSIVSIGVAYARGHAYGAKKNTNSDVIEVGIGVHGEPGWMKAPLTATAKDIVNLVVTRLLRYLPESGPMCVMLNNLGAVPRIEMAILAKEIMDSAIAPRVELFAGPAPYSTALNTYGFSISVLPLEGALRERLLAPTECTAWVKPVVPARSITRVPTVEGLADAECEPLTPSDHPVVRRLLGQVCDALIEASDEVGSLSAGTGTGRLGLALVRFATRLRSDFDKLPMACPRQLFAAFAQHCVNETGVLFSLAQLVFSTASRELAGCDAWKVETVVEALNKGAAKAQEVCGVGLNQRTLLDALLPALAANTRQGLYPGMRRCASEEACSPTATQRGGEGEAWDDSLQWRRVAAAAARRGARSTAHMIRACDWAAYVPLVQRAGCADGGAVVVATIFTALETPFEAEGAVRRFPEESPDGEAEDVLSRGFVADDEEGMEKKEKAARQDINRYYLLKGKFSDRVHHATASSGRHAGREVVMWEWKLEDLETRGLADMRRMLVLDHRRLLNWFFRPKHHVAEMLEMIVTPQSCFYVMEFLGGWNLKELLNTGEQLSHKQIARILHDILKAVDAVHRVRLFHRNIKTEKFQFDALGNVKLTDISVTMLHLAEAEERANIVGTPAYMSPEALLGCARQPADMWSVGVILHLMLTETFPFKGRTREEVRGAQSQPVDLSTGSWKEQPPLARDMVEKTLEFNAFKRITVEQALSHQWIQTIETEFVANFDSVASGCSAPSAPSAPSQPSKVYKKKSWATHLSVCIPKPEHVRKTLYLVRHGEALHNVEEKAAKRRAAEQATATGVERGTPEYTKLVEAETQAVLRNPLFFDAPLSELGQFDALRAKCEFEGLQHRGFQKPTVVLSSSLQRALQTAAMIFPYHANVYVREQIRERRTGHPCDSRHVACSTARQPNFRQMDFTEVEELDTMAPDAAGAAVEQKSEVRTRAAAFLRELPRMQLRAENRAVQEHTAIALVSHKGFLRELERGPLGNPEATEFGNCEVRVYEVEWSATGDIQRAKCLYNHSSLCTLMMQNFPASWLTPDAISFLPTKVYALLKEFGELRDDIEVEERASGPVVTAVFESQSSAGDAAHKLHGLDVRSEAEKRLRPTAHEKDRFWAQVAYDLEPEPLSPY